MATAASRDATGAKAGREAPPGTGDGGYVLPMVHTHVPAPAVEWGFWAALAGTVMLGAVDPPLALLVGAGVVVARHRHR